MGGRSTDTTRRWIVTGLAGLLLGCAATPSLAPASDAKPSPRLVAVGDLHGDMEAYREIMRGAGLIDADGDWSGGTATLVQTGDLTDRGPDSRAIIESLQQLEKQAKRAGGEVIVLLGNHEAMNVTGDLRYVHPGEYAAFVTPKSEALRQRYLDALPEGTTRDILPDIPLGWVEHRAAWNPKGEYGRWATHRPAVAVKMNTIFAHGGLSGAYAESDIKTLNRTVSRSLRKADIAPDAIINAEDGPLWFRGFSGDETPEREAELTAVLARHDAQRMVVGHTPSRRGIRTRYDGRLIQIDTGAAAHYGGTRSWLEIVGDRVTLHDNGTARQLN